MDGSEKVIPGDTRQASWRIGGVCEDLILDYDHGYLEHELETASGNGTECLVRVYVRSNVPEFNYLKLSLKSAKSD
jgi:hypothetical protein